MKLDTAHMRYLTKNDFRVLTAMEMGSKNHQVVPTPLIVSVSGLRNESLVQKSISNLAKIKLIVRERNAAYDGYKLSYRGYDYLALKAMVQRETVYAVGGQIGIGKESDIFTVADAHGTAQCLKVHRLGRVSFRTVKNSRDYLGKRQSASWMYLSRLAAQKEFKFMQVLYENGFPVPVPIDQSRHQVVMSLIDGVPLRRVREHDDPARLYALMMEFVARLANNGLIHGDFNEFNIMVREYDEANPDHEIVVIDFPQCVSIDHKDAQMYFERDVNAIRHFFRAKFEYSGKYPKWKDVKREKQLDMEADASGTDKKALRELEKHMLAVALEGEDDLEFDDESGKGESDNETSESDSESEYSDESDESDELELTEPEIKIKIPASPPLEPSPSV